MTIKQHAHEYSCVWKIVQPLDMIFSTCQYMFLYVKLFRVVQQIMSIYVLLLIMSKTNDAQLWLETAIYLQIRQHANRAITPCTIHHHRTDAPPATRANG